MFEYCLWGKYFKVIWGSIFEREGENLTEGICVKQKRVVGKSKEKLPQQESTST
jgi:hypothetical protein